jgi:hypothetical protein
MLASTFPTLAFAEGAMIPSVMAGNAAHGGKIDAGAYRIRLGMDAGPTELVPDSIPSAHRLKQ